MLDQTKRFLQKDGKAVIVAMDHGQVGAMPGFENPKATLEKVIKGEPDGVLALPNFIRNFKGIFSTSPYTKLIVRVDSMFTSTTPGEMAGFEGQTLLTDPDEAIAVDADAIATLLIYGREDPQILRDNIKYIAYLSKECHKKSLVHICEVPLWGKTCPSEPAKRDAFMRNACRAGFELGADIIKGPALHDRKNMKQLMSELPIPYLVLGGEKMNTEQDVIKLVRECIEDGACGIMIGRNIWQHKQPEKLIRALKGIVHDGITDAEVSKILA